MFLGSVVENLVATDPAVDALETSGSIARLGTAAPGQPVADFVINDGGTQVGIDITGSSATSIANHLGRAYVTTRAQILEYAFVQAVYQ
jgi:hypothetical protein